MKKTAIDFIFITHNRLEYTKRALASVLADATEEFALTIWDNASTDGTIEYLKKEVNDHRISDVIFSKENIGQTAAVNEMWNKSKADLIGKLDNDCLVTPGWTRTLAQAHLDIEKLGVVACWHFFPDDFDYQRAIHKIQQFGNHQIFRHPWTCGTGLLMKNETYKRFGPLSSRRNGTTDYWVKLAKHGMINGFYYPLIYQEHMDDPKSRYCNIKDAESFAAAAQVTVGLQAGRYKDMIGRLEWREEILRNLLDDPYDVKYYYAWRKRYRSLKNKLKNMVFRKGKM